MLWLTISAAFILLVLVGGFVIASAVQDCRAGEGQG